MRVAGWIGGLQALGLALALGCAAPLALDLAAVTDGRPLSRSGDGLYRIPAARVGAIYLRPGVELWRYDAFVVDRVALFYRSPPQLPSSFHRRLGNYLLRPEAEDRVRRMVREALQRELSSSQALALASEPEAGTLRVTAGVVDFVWETPPPRGGETSAVNITGTMTLVVNVRDAGTGEVLVRLADRRLIRPESSLLGGYENSSPNNWAGVRYVSATWARLTRQALDALRGVPPLPMPPESQ